MASEVLEPESENGFVKFETIKVIKNQELPIYRYLTNEKIYYKNEIKRNSYGINYIYRIY